MPGQLTFLTLPVTDLPSATRFYECVFGWPAPRCVPNAVFFELPGLTLALMERPAFNQFTGNADASSPTSALVSWNVPRREEVDELIHRALAAGATVRRAPATLAWGGHAGVFATPDGQLWEIVWNPRAIIPSPENNL
jgi:predicted lactoylglutathione lyase